MRTLRSSRSGYARSFRTRRADELLAELQVVRVVDDRLGGGATAYVGEAISGLGSNMLFVLPGTQRGSAR
jgi:hypothetical protein